MNENNCDMPYKEERSPIWQPKSSSSSDRKGNVKLQTETSRRLQSTDSTSFNADGSFVYRMFSKLFWGCHLDQERSIECIYGNPGSRRKGEHWLWLRHFVSANACNSRLIYIKHQRRRVARTKKQTLQKEKACIMHCFSIDTHVT